MNTWMRRAITLSLLALAACSGHDETPSRAVDGSGAPEPTGTGAVPTPPTSGAGSSSPAPISVPVSPAQPVSQPTAGSNAPPATAGAAGAMQSPPPAAGMPRRPAEDLDPNVTFEWAETTPGTSEKKNCRAGKYGGSSTYLCMPVDAGFGDIGGFGAELTAVINLELAESANGEFLEIANGEFSSISADVFGLIAQLRGTLDCSTLQFSATTQDGNWGLGDPNLGILPLGTFEAMLTGTLDPATGTLSGTWSITGSVPFVCMGPWSATLER